MEHKLVYTLPETFLLLSQPAILCALMRSLTRFLFVTNFVIIFIENLGT
jgi:hypothetical protein